MQMSASVAILLHDFSAGGSERIAIRLGNAWADEGRHVLIFCGSVAGPLIERVSPAVSVLRTEQEIVRGRGSRRRLARLLAALVETHRPDVVFVPGNFHIAVAAALLALPRRLRPAIVVKLSNPIGRADRRGLRRWLFELRLRRRLRHADAVVAMSPMLAAEAHAVLRHPDIVTIAQPTLDDRHELPQGANLDSTELVAVGRLVPQKNFRLAVAALAALSDQKFSLTIVGEGPERQAIENAALGLGVAARVSLPGYVPDPAPILARARVFLLTSDFEGFPAVAVEALAAGVPVVATACSPAIGEIISRPELGTIVAPGDAAGIARAVDRILQQPPRDRARLAESVAHHRIGPIAREYLALFDRLTRAAR